MADTPSLVESETLDAARIRAIQFYNNMEQYLCQLFAVLLRTDPKCAGILYFRMGGGWQRNKALELLLEHRFGAEYDAYWHGLPGEPGRPKTTGLLALIRQLDERRNQVVHWQTCVSLDRVKTETLIPPNIWDSLGGSISLSIADIDEFTRKADFAGRSVNIFSVCHDPRFAQIDFQAWREILQQPCTYPPSESHPLARTGKAPDSPPQSSQA